MFKVIYIYILFATFQLSGDKSYIKNYHENGQIKSEGWINNNLKDGYWFTYYENGLKKEEGHFKNNKKIKWWIFYDIKSNIEKKCEFENDKMNGYSITYLNGDPIRGEKYKFGKKVKQWNSLSEFKKDNFIALVQ